MLKSGFRGERKGNPHPVHILSYSETSPKERGNVETEKGRNDEGRMTNDKGNVVKMSSFIHTPLSRCTYPAVAGYLQRGNVATEKG